MNIHPRPHTFPPRSNRQGPTDGCGCGRFFSALGKRHGLLLDSARLGSARLLLGSARLRSAIAAVVVAGSISITYEYTPSPPYFSAAVRPHMQVCVRPPLYFFSDGRIDGRTDGGRTHGRRDRHGGAHGVGVGGSFRGSAKWIC